jgi:hypothetical protein
MIAVILLTTLIMFDNQEFLAESERQIDEGYKWTYVGKSKPSGTPAITIKSPTNEYILYRLEK